MTCLHLYELPAVVSSSMPVRSPFVSVSCGLTCIPVFHVQTADGYYSNPQTTMYPAPGPNPVFPDGTYSMNNVCDGYLMSYPLFSSASPNMYPLGQATVFKVR